MSNRKITDMAALTTPASDDVLPIVDISEAAAADKNKKISIEELFKGAPNGTAAAPSIAFESDSDSGIFLAGTNTVGITTAGTQRVTVDSSGNVGIGETAAANLLHVKTSDTGITPHASAQIVLERSGTNYLQLLTANTGTQGILFGDSDDNDRGKIVYDHSSDHLRVEVAASEALRIDSSGRVGIGTSSPNHLLTLKGTQAFQATNSTNAWLAYTYTDNTLRLNYNGAGADEIVVDSSGNVGIGTSSADRTLHVRKDDAAAVKFGGESGGDYAIEIGQLGSSSSPGFNATGGSSMLFRMGGTEAARLDSSGRLLVGTTTEGEATADNLTIANSGHCGITLRSGTSSVGTIFFSDATSGTAEYQGYVQYDHSGNYLKCATAATERMRIDSSGNLGLGTSAPGQLLHLNSSASTAIQISDGTNNQFISSIKTAGNFANGSTAGDVLIRGQSGFAVSSNNGSSVALKIDSSGKVGIGCTPVRDLQLHTSDASSELMLSNSTTGATAGSGFMIQQDGNDNYIWNKENSFMSFGTNATERMRIDDSGNVGIGTSSPSKKLHIVPSGSNAYDAVQIGDGLYLGNTSNNNNAALFHQGGGADLEIGSQQHITFTTGNIAGNATERMRIDSSGNVLIGTSVSNGSYRLTINDPGDSLIAVRSDAAADSISQALDFGVGTGSRSSTNLTGVIQVDTSDPENILYTTFAHNMYMVYCV